MSDNSQPELMVSEVKSVESIWFSNKKEFVTNLVYKGCMEAFKNNGIDSLTSMTTDRFIKIVWLLSLAADELEKTGNQTWAVQPKPET